MALLSIVTVVRNDPTGLRRTLDSIAHPGNRPDELVILDGSDDRGVVPALLRDYADLPTLVSWRPAGGVYPAMNDALALVSGEYVYFLNAGDRLAGPDVVERIAAALVTSCPQWAMGRVTFVAADGSHLPEPRWSYSAERGRLFARGRFPAHQGVVVRTEALRALGGFDTTYRVAADYASILRLSCVSPPLELGFTLAEFPIGGLSTTDWRVGLREFHRARRETFHPTGAASIAERARTAQRWAATSAYRTLWAPGRPLGGIATRIRSRPGR